VSSLERLGWHPFFEAQRMMDMDGHESAAMKYARVVEEQRGAYRLAGEFDGWAEVSGRFRHEASAAADYPAVGDWVGVAAGEDGGRAIIRRRLERRSTVSRAASGPVGDQQVLAANVDTIFLVSALTQDVNVRRMERYLTIVWEAGAVPVIVLNKADLSEDPETVCATVRARVPFVDVIAVSASADRGLDPLMPYLQPASTVALLGMSGVGKSTIVNGLLGVDAQRIAALGAEGKGRHTTTARQLFEIANGALLIDTPGMRELQPWTDESGIGAAFEDIAGIAAGCRFADCTHEEEPGCAVREALAAGRLDRDRLENYRRLVREAAYDERKHDKAAAAEHKRYWKQLHKAAKALYRERERERS
jgi:ribosome biogenesis GTPase / thiamine phosphate phosphatase